MITHLRRANVSCCRLRGPVTLSLMRRTLPHKSCGYHHLVSNMIFRAYAYIFWTLFSVGLPKCGSLPAGTITANIFFLQAEKAPPMGEESEWGPGDPLRSRGNTQTGDLAGLNAQRRWKTDAGESARFIQRLYARPRYGDGPEESMGHPYYVPQRPGKTVEAQGWGARRRFPGGIVVEESGAF